MKKTLILFLFGLLLFPFNAFCKNEKMKRSISIDSGYTAKAYSNRAFSYFGIEMLQLGSLGYDAINNKTILGNNLFLRFASLGLYTLFVQSLYHQSYELSYHEWGHFTRLGAMGSTPYMMLGTSGMGKEYRDFLSYYIATFGHTSGGGSTSSDFGVQDFNLKTTLEWGTVVSAGGVNNMMYFSEKIEDEIAFGNGHVLYLYPYINAKLAARNYVDRSYKADEQNETLCGDDMKGLETNFTNNGLNINRDDIKKGSLKSLAFSSTFYTLILSTLRHIFIDNVVTMPSVLFGLKLPETEFYINKDGLSYKFRSGLFGDTYGIPLAYEYIYKGRKKKEYTLGLEYFWDKRGFKSSNISFNIIKGDKMGYSLSVDKKMGELTLQGGVKEHSLATLDGLRNTTKVSPSSLSSKEIWVKLSFIY